MEQENPQLYKSLTSDLTTENVKSIQEIFKLGEQRQEARRSKKIEEAGGNLNITFFQMIRCSTKRWNEIVRFSLCFHRL